MRWSQVIIIGKNRKKYTGKTAVSFIKGVIGEKEFPKRLPTTDEETFYALPVSGEMIIDVPGVRDYLKVLLGDNIYDVNVEPVPVIKIHRTKLNPKPKVQLAVKKATVNQIAEKPLTLCWFGTDLKKDSKGNLTQNDVKTIFGNALKAGFTCFDTAYKYKLEDGCITLKLLDEAVNSSGVERKKITVLYKVAHNFRLDEQIGIFKDMVWGKKILMLHDIESDSLEEWTKEVLKAAKEYSMEFGVSNLDIAYFDVIQEWAKAEGKSINYVENRYTPYSVTQGEIIEKCKELNITYLSYGIGGSSFQGSCDSVAGNPTDLLFARLDKRLINKVKSNDDLMFTLCQWAFERKIIPIVKTTNVNRMASYMKGCEVSKEFSEVMVNWIIPRNFMGEPDPLYGGLKDLPDELGKLIISVPSPMLWRIIEILVKNGLKDLIIKMLMSVKKYRTVDTCGYNFLRMAFNLQMQLQNEGPEKWEEKFVEIFKKRSLKLGKPEVFDCITEWACRNFTEKDQGGSVDQIEEKILNGTYKPATPVTDTGKKNTGLTRLRTVRIEVKDSAISQSEGEQLEDKYLDYTIVVTMECTEKEITFTYYHDKSPGKTEEIMTDIKKSHADAKVTEETDRWSK